MTNYTIHIDSKASDEEISLYLYDIAGRKVLYQIVLSDKSIDLPKTLQAGIYFYQLIDNDKIIANGKIFKN